MESLTPSPDSVDKKLKITHVECHPECLVIMFQAQYSVGCELDYFILQSEIQRVFKVKDDICVGGSCLVEDTEGEWHRGRVLSKKGNICETFLIDTGLVLAVEETRLAAASDKLFQLPPKVVLGVFASVLPLGEKWSPKAVNYFSSLVGLQITGHVRAVTPYQLFILEVRKIITDVLELQLGKFIDGDAFCLVVETLRALPQGILCKRMPQLVTQNYPFRELLTLNNSEKPTDFWHIPDQLFPCLPVGSKENVKITGAVSPNKFYCQIQKWQKELERLTGAMHVYYEALVGENTNTSCDSFGLLCAAKRQNGQWHRGVIKQLLSDQVEVWFMDFGIIEAVPPSCVWKLKAEFMTLPMISFPCTLSCFGSQDEAVIEFQLKELTQALIGQTSVCVQVDLYNNTERLYYITLQKQNLGINAEHPENQNETAAPCGSLLETKTRSIALNHKLSPERNNSSKNCSGNKDKKTCLPAWDISFSSHCKRLEMQMNSFYGAFVVHVINPSDFWIQMCIYQNEFHALMTNIACAYSQYRDDEMVLKKPEPGLLCCARYSKDGCYYRGIVTKVFRVSIMVYFLDFGNTDTIPCHHVKTLLPEFSDLPALAMCCSLACTFPVDGVWVKKETDFFKNVVLNKPVLLHVVGKQNNKYIVNVQCHTGFLQGNVATCMVQAGYAEYWLKPPDSVLKAAKKRHNGNHLKCKKGKVSAENTSNIFKNKVSGNGDILQKEKSLNVLSVPRQSVVPSCLGEGAVSKMHKSVCEEKLVYKELVFKPGAVNEVVCSCIFSPADFSCQLQNKLPELNNLMGQIQTYYKDNTSPYKTGQVACVVKYPKDGRWYRATVVEEVSTNEVDVLFVDYGYQERISLKDVQGVVPDFLTLESQAFRCGLKNVVLQTDSINWSEEVHRRFEDFISSSRGPLTCTIYAVVLVSRNYLCNVVDLQTPLTSVEEILRECNLTQPERVGLRNLSSLGSLYSFCYSSFNIKIGSEEEVYITHINSPSEFYCQLNRNSETLEALMKKVSDVSKMSSNANYHGNTRLCIAKYVEDGLFYRALAFPVESTSFLLVDYVDFGNRNMVERDQLMPIPDSATDLLFTPMQAIKFCLSDLRGAEFPAKITTWFVKTFLGKLLKAVILSREPDGKIVVDLYDGQLKVSQKIKEKVLEELAQESHTEQFRSNEGGICHMKDDKGINEVSVKDPEILKLKTEVKCQAYYEYYQANTGENFEDEEQTACSTRELCSGFSKQQTLQASKEQGFRNTFSALLENGEEPWIGQPASHSLSYSALHSKEITVNGLCESQTERPNCTGQQEKSNKNIPTLISLPQRDIQVNTEVAGYISHMNSPSSFYVHFAEDENLIIKLADDLNESLENRGQENCLNALKVGDLIVAEHDADCFYYRAVIKTLKSGNSYEVEFIDYGNAAVVNSSKICRIPEKFLTLPRFSVHCFLSSVNSVPGESWTKESAAYFARTVIDKPVACKFLQQHGEKWEIDVICDGESLCNSLLHKIDSIRWNSTWVFSLENKPKQNSNPPKSKNSLGGKNKIKTAGMKNTSVKSLSLLHQVLNSGQVEAAEVVSISKNGDFYVQLLKNLQILHELNVMLDKEAQRGDLLRVDDIEQGLECITQSERNLKWNRSKVIKKFVREKLMLVFFTDYGICEMVSLNNAKMLSDEIKSIPKQAVYCRWICSKNLKKIHLAHVVNALLDCEIRILFLRYLKSSDIWEVDILVGEYTLQEYLNQLLSHCWTVAGPEKCSNTNCKEFDTSFKINSVMWMLLRTGRTYPGCATAVTDPSNFSIQFEIFFDCMQNLSLLLCDLPDNLPALPEELVIPGASCLIEFGQEAEWYRAEICEVTGQSVVLTFIDYGFLRTIPYSDIHKLKVVPESLLYLPRLAHSCSLHDTVPGKGEHWSEEAILLFQQLLHKPGLIFHFIHYGSEMKLEVNVFCEDSSLSDALIAAGHAVCSHSRCCPIAIDRL